MSRLTHLPPEQQSPEQKDLFADIIANRPVQPTDGVIGGPFDVWLRSPQMGKLLIDLGGFFRFNTSVDRRYIELAILVTGAYWQAQFEWYAHEPMARKAGVPENLIAAIKAGDAPVLEDAGDIACHALATELHHKRTLSQATFDLAHAQFGDIGVAELVSLCGFYTMVSMQLNGFAVELPDGADYPFPRAR